MVWRPILLAVAWDFWGRRASPRGVSGCARRRTTTTLKDVFVIFLFLLRTPYVVLRTALVYVRVPLLPLSNESSDQ